MTIEDQASKIARKLMKKPLTAGELAERAGLSSGRAIAKALGHLVDARVAIRTPGRKPTYSRA